MDENALASNANAIISSIEKKLPNGSKNIKKIMFKTTMGKVMQIEDVKN
jgi:large subunit ribosomal protein L1